jgi:hypothetical protein
MRWETRIPHPTYRLKDHFQVVAVMGTTPNNISTSLVAIKTEVPQRHPLGRVLGIIHNDTLPGVEWISTQSGA